MRGLCPILGGEHFSIKDFSSHFVKTCLLNPTHEKSLCQSCQAVAHPAPVVWSHCPGKWSVLSCSSSPWEIPSPARRTSHHPGGLIGGRAGACLPASPPGIRMQTLQMPLFLSLPTYHRQSPFHACSSVVFSIFTRPCAHHYALTPQYSSPPKNLQSH